MKIAVLGAGHIGGTLAKKFAKAGHTVILGVRNLKDPKVLALVSKHISAHTIPEAAQKAEIIVTAVYPQFTKEIARKLGNVSKKIIIDAMNEYLIRRKKLYKLLVPNQYSYSSLLRKFKKHISFINVLRKKLERK